MSRFVRLMEHMDLGHRDVARNARLGLSMVGSGALLLLPYLVVAAASAGWRLDPSDLGLAILSGIGLAMSLGSVAIVDRLTERIEPGPRDAARTRRLGVRLAGIGAVLWLPFLLVEAASMAGWPLDLAAVLETILFWLLLAMVFGGMMIATSLIVFGLPVLAVAGVTGLLWWAMRQRGRLDARP